MKTVQSGIRFVQDPDGGILLDIEQDRFFSLNQTAALIWEQLANGKSLDVIAHDISHASGVSADLVLAHAQELLSELESHGLIETSSDECYEQELP